MSLRMDPDAIAADRSPFNAPPNPTSTAPASPAVGTPLGSVPRGPRGPTSLGGSRRKSTHPGSLQLTNSLTRSPSASASPSGLELPAPGGRAAAGAPSATGSFASNTSISAEPRPLHSPRRSVVSGPKKMSATEAEARVRKQAPYVTTDPKHKLCDSQMVHGFAYLMQRQDHTTLEMLRESLFPALAHSLEAVLATAVSATVDSELQHATKGAADAASKTEPADATETPEQLKSEFVAAARRDYANRSSPAASSPLLVSPPRQQPPPVAASPPPEAGADGTDDGAAAAPVQPKRTGSAASRRTRPLLPVGTVGNDPSGPHRAAASGKPFGALPEHPIVMLARELKKRAGRKDKDYDLPPAAGVCTPPPEPEDSASTAEASRRTSVSSRPISARAGSARRVQVTSPTQVRTPVSRVPK